MPLYAGAPDKSTFEAYRRISVKIRPIANAFLLTVNQCGGRSDVGCWQTESCASLGEALERAAAVLEPPREEQSA